MLDQKTLQNLLSTIPADITFADFLSEKGYSTQINHLNIHLNPSQKIDFSGCQFNAVQFTGNFHGSTFEQVSFTNSNFRKAIFSMSTFKDSTFHNCGFVDSNLKGSSFINNELNATKFWNSDISNAAFINSSINHAVFAKSKFDNVLDYENKITDLHIVFNQDYYKVDYAFNEAHSHQVKPVIAIIGDTQWHSTPYYILDKYSGKPVTIDQDAPASIDTDALNVEIKHVLNEIKESGLKYPSIVQQILHSEQPMIQTIKASAYQAMGNADAVWIPGGPDLHPEFYGEENTYSYPSYDYYREILEFSLTEAALKMDKPILGVCHGSQLVNVYYGGTLHQNVDGHGGGITPQLEVHTHDGLLGSVIDGPIHGPSYHHQAVKDVAHPLQVVATYNGVIKATQATDGSKMMLTQFHPEYEYDKNSENILNLFVDLSSEEKMRAKAIQISEVVDFGTSLESILANDKPIEAVHHHQGSTLSAYLPHFVTQLCYGEVEAVTVI